LPANTLYARIAITGRVMVIFSKLADMFRGQRSVGSTEDILRRIIGQQAAGNISGLDVNADSAMRFATVWACVRLISDTVAQMPAKIIVEDNAGIKGVDYANPLHIAISQAPENGLIPFTFWKRFVQDLLLKGVAVARKLEVGNLVRLVPVDITRVERSAVGEYTFYHRTSTREEIPLFQREALFAFFALDSELLPLDPIRYGANAIGLGMRAEKHAGKSLAKDATPNGVLSVPGPLDKKVKQSIKESWDDNYGADGRGGVAVLEGGAQYHAISMSNEAAQLIQSRQFQRQEVCGFFGVPPHMISDTAQAKGWSTMEQMMTEFITLAINPITIRLEQAVRFCCIPRAQWGKRYCKFSTAGLLRGDTGARSNYYATGIDKGYLTVNEVRGFEDMNPLPDGGGNQGDENE